MKKIFKTSLPSISDIAAFDRCRHITDQSGFTLVELAIVLVIVMILATIAIPSFSKVRLTAQNSACTSDLSNIQKVIEAYRAEKSDLPDNLGVDGVKLDTMNDPWRKPYHYMKTPILTFLGLPTTLLNTDYDLFSSGADGLANDTNQADPVNDDNIVRASNGVYFGLRPE